MSGLTRALAVEWGPRRINVNAVAPTFIETPGTEPALSDSAFRADVEERIAALHRVGQPTDVAQAPDSTWHYVLVSLKDGEPVVRSFRIVDGVVSEEPVALEAH